METENNNTPLVPPINLNSKTFLVVTGASRGIGSAVAVSLAAKYLAGSKVVLMARSKKGLDKTKELIGVHNKGVQVINIIIDLTRPTFDELVKILRDALDGDNINDYQVVTMVHNVGTIGDVTKYTRDFGTDTVEWEEYYALNLFSVISMNRAFLEVFNTSNPLRLIINITSKCSVVPCKTLVLYWWVDSMII